MSVAAAVAAIKSAEWNGFVPWAPDPVRRMANQPELSRESIFGAHLVLRESGYLLVPRRLIFRWAEPWEDHPENGYWIATTMVQRVRTKIPARVRRAVIVRDGLRCGLCGDPVSTAELHLDHIVPWAAGGPDTVDNLRVTHARCNMRRPRRAA